MAEQISRKRKTTYYLGIGITIIGGILFALTFVTFTLHFGDFKNFDSNAKFDMLLGIGGMALLMVGSMIRRIGARGLAGSGVVLDPDKAREDLEPYTRMAGGMVKDALDEAQVKIGGQEPEKVVVKIKCQACGRLNADDARFCQECGKAI